MRTYAPSCCRQIGSGIADVSVGIHVSNYGFLVVKDELTLGIMKRVAGACRDRLEAFGFHSTRRRSCDEFCQHRG